MNENQLQEFHKKLYANNCCYDAELRLLPNPCQTCVSLEVRRQKLLELRKAEQEKDKD
jgi:hypothetical protein